MAGADTSFHIGHRERLRQKFLDGRLADYELLELLLGYAIPRRDVRPLAHTLVAKFGGVGAVLTAPIDKLTEIPGMGQNTAVFIKSINQLMIIGYRDDMKSQSIFHDRRTLANYCKAQLSGKTVEEVHALYLDVDYRLLSDEVHTRGTRDESSVYPREILKRALVLNARSVVMVHNHPTAGHSFSQDDIEITTQVQELLNAVGIELYDHLVVSGTIVYSARDLLLLK